MGINERNVRNTFVLAVTYLARALNLLMNTGFWPSIVRDHYRHIIIPQNVRLTNTILPPTGPAIRSGWPSALLQREPEDSSQLETGEEVPAQPEETAPSLHEEAVQQIEREREVKAEVQEEIHRNGAFGAVPVPTLAPAHVPALSSFKKFIEAGKTQKTPRLLLQIWQSDFSIIAFVLVMVTFYLMKYMRYPPIGVLFFLLAMATVDAILSIFVVRLSFHQNKHGFYRTEDFERDWLRYRMLLSMTKAALLFVVGTSCGISAVIASYIVWFFTSTQRLRYLILRWSMDDHYPELQRWSIFALLREAGIEPKLKNFNLVAIIGVAIGFLIVFVF